MMEELRPGLHRWTARHPSWHPADAFGADVASFALRAQDGTVLLIDPLLPDPEGAPGFLDEVTNGAREIAILITIGYHVRSAQALSERYGGAPIHGPQTLRRRLGDTTNFRPLAPGDPPGPGGATTFAIGRPRRSEAPIHLPSHGAIAFGDALVTTPDGALRMWCQDPDTPDRRAFYRHRLAPTLQPLVALGPEAILTTHGAPILHHATDALANAIAEDPWFHRG
jgi:hypothetical protein